MKLSNRQAVGLALIFVSILYFILGVHKQYGDSQFYSYTEHIVFLGYGLCSYFSCQIVFSYFNENCKLSLFDNIKILVLSGAINAVLSTLFFLFVRLALMFIFDFESWVPPIYGILMNILYTFFLIHLILAALLIAYQNVKLAHLAEIRRVNSEKAHSELRLKRLQQQFTPHFLFNNLNILSSLIPTDRELAERYVNLLSSLYRFVTRHVDDEVIELEEELVFVAQYSQLMNIRFSNAYKIETVIDADLVGLTYVVPGAIQTCVENAIKHNKASESSPLNINIEYDVEAKLLRIRNAMNKKQCATDSTHTGLDNLIERYRILSEHAVDVHHTEEYFTVSLPVITAVGKI
ncbi:MAG: sensor histidine kinase [Psychrobium sp.]